MHSDDSRIGDPPAGENFPDGRRPSDAPSISLVLPAWNEAEVIQTAIAEADAALRQVTGSYEIIVVDDGSTDETAAKVREAAATNSAIKLIQHSPNRGYGAALRTGFAAAEMERVVFTDADCQFDLNELDRFVLLSRDYEVVCGYRIDRKDTPLRCLYSKVYNLLVRCLLGTGVRDVDCALKMFHRDVVRDLPITGNGFLVNSEILVQTHRKGRRLVEVGVSHRPRTLGASTVSVKHIPKVLSELTRYWWNESKFPCDPKKDRLGSEQLTGRQVTRFRSAQALIRTICIVGFLFAAVVHLRSGGGWAWTIVWCSSWMVLQFAALLLWRIRKGAQYSWAMATGVSLLFAAMVTQTLDARRSLPHLRESSIQTVELASSRSIDVSDREVPDPPSNVQTLAMADSTAAGEPDWSATSPGAGHCLLVVKDPETARRLSDQLPGGLRMTRVAERGALIIYDLLATPETPRIAERPEVNR
ncbi:glycosyltransferase family 2 protein [Roseiconus nitratireducens]|uniref:Glycosyltransferase family 2 protein n=1 Tax=Roseiconus nitratireducens TaxID=2605748 RepID=A0A5M6DB22_9BACT|nr:glycosyltransferase family 2 protein [Roseiconus nitratireducens]KAA5543716.1 glycosyltransferase family 2 protein [Roseiconus nitratireducens]